MPNIERKLLLEKLLNFEQPVQETLAELQKFGWDSDVELIHIKPAHITKLLDDFLKGKLNAAQIEEWANALECRDDVGFLPKKQSKIREAIFQLANPLLDKPITPDLANSLKIQLLQ
jgi:hypothetical protein